MVLKIGIDAVPLLSLNGGISYYLFHLLDEWMQIEREALFFLYAFSDKGEIEYFLRYAHVTLRPIPFFSFSHSLWSQTTLAFHCHRDKIDRFWGATQFIPLFKRKKMKCFLSLHDFTYLLYPQTVSFFRLCFQKMLSKKMLLNAEGIIALSHATGKLLERLYGMKETLVIHPPLKPTLRSKNKEESEALLAPHRLHFGEYLVTVGSLEPRKNFLHLLEIYCELFMRFSSEEILPLMLIGGGGWKNKKIKAGLQAAQKKYPHHIKLMGTVSDEALSFYLSGAKYYLTLSLYEGYGMPLAESRLCGTQIVAPDRPEMREAAEDDGLFFKENEELTTMERIFISKEKKHIALKTTYLSNREKAKSLACLFR